ncbi:MAG: hypothetical protein HFACDABA_02744 [Anaerolineales bacterium]|nr:hypothetical protein [Anaerolineales bacterium]
MAGSAIGYTLASGNSYDSVTMMETAAIGGAVGAFNTTVGPLAQAGASMVGAVAQTTVSDMNDGELPSGGEVYTSSFVGALSYGLGAMSAGIPIIGPYIDDVVRTGAIEYYGNTLTNRADMANDPKCFVDYVLDEMICP